MDADPEPPRGNQCRPRSPLAERLLAAQGAAGIGSTAALAKAIGISPAALAGVLSGLGRPSVVTQAKYQAFLGLGDTAFAELMAATRQASRYRPGDRAEPAPSIPPARAAHPLHGAIGMLSDPLVRKVHRASPTMRAIISRVLGEPTP